MLNGGQIFSNTADKGGGVHIWESRAVLNGGQIFSNTANKGGGLYVNSGYAALEGGQVCSNTVTIDGGGAYINVGRAILNGGQIIGNSAWNGGGVFLSEPTAVFTQTGLGIIAYNTAINNGGGVFVWDGSATLKGGQILNNTANNDGGGVFVDRGNVIASFCLETPGRGESPTCWGIFRLPGGACPNKFGTPALSGGAVHGFPDKY